EASEVEDGHPVSIGDHVVRPEIVVATHRDEITRADADGELLDATQKPRGYGDREADLAGLFEQAQPPRAIGDDLGGIEGVGGGGLHEPLEERQPPAYPPAHRGT